MIALELIAEPTPSGGWIWQSPPAIHGDALWTKGAAPDLLAAEAPKLTPSPVIWKLSALSSLKPNWDGYGGAAPRFDTIEAAKRLYMLVPPAIEPTVSCAGDGEISFVWRSTTAYLELGVDDDGSISFFGRADGAAGIRDDLDSGAESLPQSLVDFLAREFNAGVSV